MATKELDTRKPLPNKLHELFCLLYSGCGDRAFLSNGVLSYIEAYKVDTPTHRIQQKKGKMTYWDYAPKYKVAKTNASTLLTNPNIKLRIHHLFQARFNPDDVDNELMKTILQDVDLRAKVSGIHEYSELKGRITRKIKLSGAIKSTLSPERLAEIAGHVLKNSKVRK